MLKLGEKLLKRKRHRSYRASKELQAHGEREALEILKEGLAACGLAEKELKTLPGSDLRKVAIAARIWENTTVSMSWISENLAMKSAANASQQIRRLRGKRDMPKL
jgi:putative transposase